MSLQACDDFLAFIGSLGQLFLDLLVKRYVSLEHFNLLSHLVVRLDELLRIFRLVVQLCRQLVILENGETCLSLELLIVESHEVRLRLFDLEVHFLSQLLYVFDFLELSLVDLDHAFLLLGLVLYFESRDSV